MKLKKAAGVLDRSLYRVSQRSRLVGAVFLGGLILFIVADVIARYIFNQPFAFGLEVVENFLSIVVFFGLILCTAHKGHVELSVLVEKLPHRVQATISSLVFFLSTAICGAITWRLVIHAVQIKEIGTVSSILKIPQYPFIWVVALCSILITLLFLSQTVHFIKKAASE